MLRVSACVYKCMCHGAHPTTLSPRRPALGTPLSSVAAGARSSQLTSQGEWVGGLMGRSPHSVGARAPLQQHPSRLVQQVWLTLPWSSLAAREAGSGVFPLGTGVGEGWRREVGFGWVPTFSTLPSRSLSRPTLVCLTHCLVHPFIPHALQTPFTSCSQGPRPCGSALPI